MFARLWLGPVLATVVVFGGCTVANPLYTPVSIDDMRSPTGDAFVFDLTTGPISFEDLANGSQCNEGDRSCGDGASLVCEAGTPTVDRVCPDGSDCSNGYCQPPAQSGNGNVGRSCSVGGQPVENLCFVGQQADTSCEPFITGGNGSSTVVVTWVCDTPVGSGTPGIACTTGDTCRTGFCGSNGTCFRACTTDADCPQPTVGQGSGGGTQCQAVVITVEGQAVQANSCIPT